MKHLLLTSAFLCAATTLFAQEAFQPSMQSASRQSLSSERVTPFAEATRASSLEVITEAPEGTVQYYNTEGTCYYFYAYYNWTYEETRYNYYGETVICDNGDVYIRNIVPTFASYVYVKGELKDDNTISVPLPQCVGYYHAYDGNTYPINIMMMKKVLNAYGDIANGEPLEDIDHVDLVRSGDNWVMELNEGEFLANAYEDGVWYGSGASSIKMMPIDVEPLAMPENVAVERYQFVFGDEGRYVNVAFDGNDMYVEGMAPYVFGPGVVKGTIEGDKAVFKGDQYLGGDYDVGCQNYLVTATYELQGFFNYYYKTEELTLAYDASSKTLTSPEGYAFIENVGDGDVSYLYCFDDPVLKPYYPDTAPAAPMTPEYVGMMPYDSDYGMGQIYYRLPYVDVNGNILDVDRLYYNLLFDGEVYDLYTDEYLGLEEDITDIPWTYSDSYGDIYGNSTYRYMTFFIDGWDTIGIQSFYLTESGERLYSGVMTADAEGNFVGIDRTMTATDVKSVEYYDLMGRRVYAPKDGIFVKTTVLSDGSRSSVKEVLK